MNELFQWAAHPLVHRLGWALLHFLWQGAVIAALFAVAQTVWPKRSSNARYLTGCLALLLMLAAPLLTFAVLRTERPVPVAFSASGATLNRPDPSNPTNPTGVAQLSAPLTLPGSAPLSPRLLNPQSEIRNPPFPQFHSEKLLPFLVLAWLLGVSALSLRLLFGALQVARWKRRGHEPPGAPWLERLHRLKAALQISRPVRLVKSVLVEVPTVVGWLRPVILLPAGALAGLTPAQLETILAHELAHIRRHDYLVNLLQNALETLLFYHPAVWWISNCVRAEREICCDEIAIKICGDRLVYAQALAALEQLRSAQPSLALGADGGSLLERIRRLSGAPSGASFPTRRRAGGAIVAALVALIFLSLLHHPSSTAKAQPMPPFVQPVTQRGEPASANPQSAPSTVGPAKAEIRNPQSNAAPAPASSAKPAANPSGLSLVIRGPTNVLKVGDEIPMQFILSNHGTEDYKYTDRNYDRSGRMGEYKLVAKTASGGSVPDARMHFQPGMAGGLGQPRLLHPGESFSKVIALNLWALIKEPGRYQVMGIYGYDPGYDPGYSTSEPIRIIVLPRTKEEMDDYIKVLTNQIAGQLAAGPADQGLVMNLMYTCSPESIPTLLSILCQTNSGGGNAHFWATAALEDYVPHSEQSRKAILEAATKYGLNGTGLEQVLLAHEFDNQEMKPFIERALGARNPGEWPAGVWLALRYFDPAFTPRLIAIAGDSNARWDTRSIAMRVLASNRTDAGVKAIKALLKDPAPEMLRPLFETIANGCSGQGAASTGSSLRTDDFSAEDMRPLIERLLASTNQALQLQLSGVILAKQFGSDALTAQLMALATNPSPYVSGGAVYALALNRTDEGVKTLKTLLLDPDPKVSKLAEDAIRNAYTSRGDARGRPLRPDDFDVKFQQAAVPSATNPGSTNNDGAIPSNELNRTDEAENKTSLAVSPITIIYAADSTFRDLYGQQGVAAVDAALAILNNLPADAGTNLTMSGPNTTNGEKAPDFILFDGLPLPDAIRQLAQLAKLNIQFDHQLDHPTDPVTHLPVPFPTVKEKWMYLTPLQALQALLDKYDWQMKRSPSTPVVIISAKHPNAVEAKVMEVILLGYSEPTNIVNEVQKAMPAVKVIPDLRTHQVIVNCTEREMPAVKKLISRLDSATNNAPSNSPPAVQPSASTSSNPPSAITGTVLLPNGQPAAGAQLVLQRTNDLLFFDVAKGFLTENTANAISGRPEDGARPISAFAIADAGGHFHFPPMENVAALLAIHPQGFTWLPPGELKGDLVVRLEPMGRIEGTFRFGNQPGTNEEISMNANDPRLHLFSDVFTTRTDSAGRFVFTNLPAMRFGLSRMFSIDPPDLNPVKIRANVLMPGALNGLTGIMASRGWAAVSEKTKVLVKGDVTTEVELGGTGRSVVGKLAKAGMAFEWSQAYVQLEQQDLPKPEFQTYLARIADDGAFRLENVGAGNYDLEIRVSPDDGKSNVLYLADSFSALTRHVVVPEMAGGRSLEALDLGTLEIQHPQAERKIKLGGQAPAITASNFVQDSGGGPSNPVVGQGVFGSDFGQSFHGEPLNRADDPGKYVLLDLCGNYFDSDLPFLRAAHDLFAADGRLVVKSVTLGYILEDQFRTGSISKTEPWSHAYTGSIQMADWAEAYGLLDQNSMVRQIVLIGPDGKILAKDLHGDAIKAAVAKALAQK